MEKTEGGREKEIQSVCNWKQLVF